MDERTDKRDRALVSRARLAEYTGVSRAAVTNWSKRASDFPTPADDAGELFELDDVVAWLSARAIPAGSRRPHEAAGTTYADRVRANAGEKRPLGTGTVPPPATEDPAAADRGEVETRTFRILDRLRGQAPMDEACRALLELLHACMQHGESWSELVSLAEGDGSPPGRQADSDTALPSELRSFVVRLPSKTLHSTVTEVALIGSGGDRRERLASAFERVLESSASKSSPVDLHTPRSVVETATALLGADAAPGHVHDPFCRSGEFLIGASRRLPTDALAARPRLSGAGSGPSSARHCGMHLAMHGLEGEIREVPIVPGASSDLPHADLVLTNPPFNQRLLAGREDVRFRYGPPPESNANFAWLQHALASLGLGGRAGVVMATNAAFSTNAREEAIRSAMVEDGAVEAVVTLPDRLFENTGIPVDLWLLRRPTGSCSELLLIDASALGTMASRTRRVLGTEAVDAVQSAYAAWRGHDDEPADGLPPFARAVGIEEIRLRAYSLHPAAYIGEAVEEADDGPERFRELAERLAAFEARIPETDARTRRLIQEISAWIR